MTYRAESDGCGSQAYQASVACMRLMDGISEVVAELVKHGFDSGIILGMDKFADNALKPVKVSTMFKCETDPLYPVPRPPPAEHPCLEMPKQQRGGGVTGTKEEIDSKERENVLESAHFTLVI